ANGFGEHSPGHYSLELIHLVSIPVTNTSVNPARSTGVALFAGGWALGQLWLFWVAPIAGAVLGAVVYRFIGSAEKGPTRRSASAPDRTGSSSCTTRPRAPCSRRCAGCCA